MTLGAVLGSAWMVGLALPPYVLSRAIDSLADGQRDVVLGWTAVLLLVGRRPGGPGHLAAPHDDPGAHGCGAADGVEGERPRASGWETRWRGASLTGEVVAIGGGDAWTIGRSLTATGRGWVRCSPTW